MYTYVLLYVCMYVCMYVCIYIYIYIRIPVQALDHELQLPEHVLRPGRPRAR